MRISAKGMYAIGSLIFIFKNENKNTSILNISKNLGVSKVYLEQVFSLLKKGNLVISSKGPCGGYKLKTHLKDISLLDVLSITETNILENNNRIFIEKYPQIDIEITNIINLVNNTVRDKLRNVNLEQIYENIKRNSNDNEYTYYI